MDIDLLLGFTPTLGTQFQVVTCGSGCTGTFTLHDADLGGGLSFVALYTGTAVILEVQQTGDPVPEPSTYVLLASGLLGLGLARVRQRRRQA